MLKVRRVYSAPEKSDGFRILVDRIWPRGLSKEKAEIDLWYRDIAPSKALCKSFDHIPEKFAVFKEEYFKELAENPVTDAFLYLLEGQLDKGDVTLVYGAKDEQNNQAVVLQEYVFSKFNK